MKKVIVGFSVGSSFVSKIICFFEKNNFSHTYFNFYSNLLSRDIIYQSNFLGVSFINKQNFLKHSKIINEIEFEISDDLYIKTMQFCVDKAGDTMYDFKGIVGKMLVLIGLCKTNPWKNGLEKVDCNELVTAILKEMNVDLDLDSETSGPKVLFKYLTELKQKELHGLDGKN